MKHLSPSDARAGRTHGFSLIELSIVTAILALVSVLGLEVTAAYAARRAFGVTQDKIAAADVAIKKFYAVNGRLPCPADISVNITMGAAGTENCLGNRMVSATNIDYGTLPYITLGLPVSSIVDAYGSKLQYFVTENLATSAASFSNTANVGRIEVRTGKLEQPCSANCEVTFDPLTSTGAAYAILSSGADQRGAWMKSGAYKSCSSYNRRIDTANCNNSSSNPIITPNQANNVVLFDSRINTGNVETNYFDDIVLARGKGDLQ